MKKHGSRFLLLCLTALFLTGTAHANSMPPDYRVAVRVINAPEELYYLDLLKQLDGGRPGPAPEELDPVLLEAMEQAEPEGWLACTLSGMGDYFRGDMAGENGLHVFHGLDAPKVFRILIVTKSGESWVSEPIEREILNTSVTVDWETHTARLKPKWVAMGVQLFATLLPTLGIEGLVLMAFGLSSKRNWLVFLSVNLVTQGALSLMLSSALVQGSLYMLPFFLIFMIPVELLIAAVEANIYKLWFRGKSQRRAFWYGFAANGISYALGWVVVNLVWAGLISL